MADEGPQTQESTVWEGICLDDGSGKNVHYIDKNGKKSRNPPPNYIPESFSNGIRRYYYRGRCIRCRKETEPSFLTCGGGSFGFSLNYCADCILNTTPTIKQLRAQGDAIWATNHDTPMHCFLELENLTTIPDREAIHLERSTQAQFEVLTLAKERRNAERARSLKQFALQHGVVRGVHLSWGFGDAFDEYFGEVDGQGRPHGRGVKIFSDQSMYVGNWEEGLRHSTEPATWSRPDGMHYEGQWVRDFKHGKGHQRYPDGAEYRGEFAKGYEHGQGSKVFRSGDRFEGRFRFGKRDGPGVLTNVEGQVTKRVFRENDAVHEPAVPPISEQPPAADTTEFLFQPTSLMVLSIKALAKAMHVKRQLLPSALVHRRLCAFYKTAVAREFLATMHPPGSAQFLEAASPQAFRSLPTVSLRHTKFQHFDTECFLYFTSANAAMHTLELVNSRLDPSSLEMICKAVRTGCWRGLQTLTLSFNRVDVTVVQSLIAALREGAPRVQTLALAGCQITPQGGALLAKYLQDNPPLQDLDLAFNMIQAAGAERLAEALAVNKNLTKLNLRQNNIGTIGGEAMVEAMKTNLSLRVLCIADNKIGVHLAAELGARLRGTTCEVAESFRAEQLRTPAIHLEKKMKSKNAH